MLPAIIFRQGIPVLFNIFIFDKKLSIYLNFKDKIQMQCFLYKPVYMYLQRKKFKWKLKIRMLHTYWRTIQFLYEKLISEWNSFDSSVCKHTNSKYYYIFY